MMMTTLATVLATLNDDANVLINLTSCHSWDPMDDGKLDYIQDHCGNHCVSSWTKALDKIKAEEDEFPVSNIDISVHDYGREITYEVTLCMPRTSRTDMLKEVAQSTANADAFRKLGIL